MTEKMNMNLTFKEQARELFLRRMNETFGLEGKEQFTRMSELFLRNYLLNDKEEIFKLFDNNFYIIKEVSGAGQEINENGLILWTRDAGIEEYGTEVQKAVIKFTKNVLADSAKCDVLSNKIKRDFEIDEMKFKENQKVSKAFIKYVSSFAGEDKRAVQNKLGDKYDGYKEFLEQNDYINVKYYMRLSIDPLDFFYMGYTRTQTSCTRINWDREEIDVKSYEKAVFTYLQTGNFIATLHFTEESAKAGRQGDYRRIYSYDWNEKFLIGNRPYGASKNLNIFLANSVERFFKERLATDFLLSSSVRNIAKKTGKKDDRMITLPINQEDTMSVSYVGYIDALHYPYTHDYTITSWNEKYSLQTSLFDDNQEEQTYISLKNMTWNSKNPYHKFIAEVTGKIESMYEETGLFHLFFDDYYLEDEHLTGYFLERMINQQVEYVNGLEDVPQFEELEQELE